jgi:hypothetical protein
MNRKPISGARSKVVIDVPAELDSILKVKTKGSGVFSGLLPHRRVALV